MKIAVASDHAGFTLKEAIKVWLKDEGYDPIDFGTNGTESVDYPDFGFAAARAVAGGDCDRGIIVCGSGIGMSMVANKVPGIRAALCTNVKMAEMSRAHNNANILVLGERIIIETTALEMAEVWLNTSFEGGRHQRRIEKISNYESHPPQSGSVESERSVIC